MNTTHRIGGRVALLVALGMGAGGSIGFALGRTTRNPAVRAAGVATGAGLDGVAPAPMTGSGSRPGAADDERTGRRNPVVSREPVALPPSSRDGVPPHGGGESGDLHSQEQKPNSVSLFSRRRSTRKRIESATAEEREQVLQGVVADLMRLPLEERAGELVSLFGNEGWIGERAGPPLGREAFELLRETLHSLPDGRDSRRLLGLLGEQINHLQGVQPIADGLAFADATLHEEIQRLEDGGLVDEMVALIEEQLPATGFRELKGSELDDEFIGVMFSLAGRGSRAAVDRLWTEARENPSREYRMCALISLASAGPVPSIDSELARFAADTRRGFAERYVAWRALRRHGREHLVPDGVRLEILEAWRASGTPRMEDLFDV